MLSQSVVTFDQLNDTSKQKICEKIQRWDQSLPRRHMETMKRIDITLKEKVRTEVPDDVGEEGLDGHNHILNFDETNHENVMQEHPAHRNWAKSQPGSKAIDRLDYLIFTVIIFILTCFYRVSEFRHFFLLKLELL